MSRLGGRLAEEVAREKLADTFHFEAAGAGFVQRPAFQPRHPLGPPLPGSDRTQVEHAGHLAQQVACAAADQYHVAPGGRLAGRLGDAVKILLVRRVQAKTVGHADGFFVETLQLGIGHAFDLRRLMEQFAVEQFPAECGGQLPGNLAAAGAVLTSDGNDFHPSSSRHNAAKTGTGTFFPLWQLNNRPHQEHSSPGGACSFYTSPYQKEPEVGVISSVCGTGITPTRPTTASWRRPRLHHNLCI